MKIALVCLLILATGLVRAEDSVPLSRVILFNSGVGYFERESVVDGDGHLRLSFPVDHVNDFIRSVVIMDEERGMAQLSYESRDPIERTLKAFSIDLSENLALPQLLEAIRGAPIRLILATRAVEGRVVGIERRTRRVEGEQITEHRVMVNTDEGIQTLALDHVDRIELLDERLNADLNDALSVLAERLDRRRRSVDLRLTGERRRPVRLGYMLEAPVWKMSYRLVLDGDDVFLQGWAHVENMSDDDWHDVRLELVSGRPISFIQNLYDPIYVRRPVIDPAADAVQVPGEHEAILLGMEAMEAEAPMVMRGLMAARTEERPTRLRRALDVEPAAEAAPTGELFSFTVREPVALPRRQSAMIPVVQESMEGETLSLFNRALNDRHPLNAVDIRNRSGVFLMRGPVTVFEDNLYAGEGLMPHVPPDERQLISYAVDLAMEVQVEEDTRPRRIETMKIVHGVMHVQHKQQRDYVYQVRNKRDGERLLFIEHPKREGWDITGTQDDPVVTRDHYRFRMTVPAAESRPFGITEHRVTRETVELVSLPHERVLYYIRRDELPDRVREAMEEVALRQAAIVDIRREAGDVEKEIADIGRDQARIRDHMRVIDRASDAFKRWQQQLIDQEEYIQERHQRLRALREKERDQQGRLEAFIAELSVE